MKLQIHQGRFNQFFDSVITMQHINEAPSDVNTMLDGSTYPGWKVCHFSRVNFFSCTSKRIRLNPRPTTGWSLIDSFESIRKILEVNHFIRPSQTWATWPTRCVKGSWSICSWSSSKGWKSSSTNRNLGRSVDSDRCHSRSKINCFFCLGFLRRSLFCFVRLHSSHETATTELIEETRSFVTP